MDQDAKSAAVGGASSQATIITRVAIHHRPGQPVLLEVITSSAAYADHCWLHRDELCRLHEAGELRICLSDKAWACSDDPLTVALHYRVGEPQEAFSPAA